MKRCVFGAVLLAVLLIFCLWSEKLGAGGPDRIDGLLSRTAAAALAGDREKTAALADQALAAWDGTKSVQQWLHHGEKVQRADILFARLEALKGSGRTEELCSVCGGLQVMMEELGSDRPFRS